MYNDVWGFAEILPKWVPPMVQNTMEKTDADLQALCGTEADGISKDKPYAPLEQNNGSNDPLLSEIAEDFLNAGIFLSYC